jgi:hypothetical protein
MKVRKLEVMRAGWRTTQRQDAEVEILRAVNDMALRMTAL